jgi:hypothetical protein
MKKYITGILILSLGIFISCKKKKDDVTPAPSANAITADYYIQANIGGTVKTFQRNVNSYFNGAGGSLTAGSTGSAINQYTSTFAKYSIGGGLSVANDNLTVGFNLNSQDAQSTDYTAFFVTGAKAYVATEDDLNGVFIDWVDESGATWSTAGGSQSGSVFTITALGSTVLNSTNYNWVKATFNCTLYNSVGSSKIVTGGLLKGLVLPYTP